MQRLTLDVRPFGRRSPPPPLRHGNGRRTCLFRKLAEANSAQHHGQSQLWQYILAVQLVTGTTQRVGANYPGMNAQFRLQRQLPCIAVDSLVSVMQNEKELDKLMGANSSAALYACGANYPSQERAISSAARTTLHQGGSILPAAQTTRTRH